VGEARRRREAEKARLAAIVTPMEGGGHMVYTGTGHNEEIFVKRAPDAVPGEHRWAVVAMWACDPTKMDPNDPQTRYLDHENLISLSPPMCFNCEEMYTEALAKQRCKGDPT
jgi:hypothetical protein